LLTVVVDRRAPLWEENCDTVAAAPVKPLIGGVTTSLAGQEFSLVSFDKSGYPQPLPPGLGDLPLYSDDDGFFSVNGPLDVGVFSPHIKFAPVNHGNHSTIPSSITSITGITGECSHIAPDGHPCLSNDDAISRFVTSPPPTPFIPYPSLMVQ